MNDQLYRLIGKWRTRATEKQALAKNSPGSIAASTNQQAADTLNRCADDLEVIINQEKGEPEK